MKAAIITRFGGPEVLEVRDVDDPEPGPHEVLVRVRASGLNRADLLQRLGRYPPPNDAPRDIPGIEFAGSVERCGDGVSRWSPGDRVFGLAGGGAQAEFLVANEGTLAAVPDRLSWLEAAAVPEAFITAHDAIFSQAGLTEGETLLVFAAGSGVGLAGVQLARAAGARVFGTSRTPEKIEEAKAFGLTDGVAVHDDLAPLTAAVARWTDGRGIDVVLDLVGGPYLPVAVESVALKGRIMLVGTVAGPQATLDLRRMLGRRITMRGTVLRARSLAEKTEVTRAFAQRVVPWLQSGVVKPVVDSVFPLAHLAQAHRRMESNETFGKIVIEVAA